MRWRAKRRGTERFWWSWDVDRESLSWLRDGVDIMTIRGCSDVVI